MINFPTKKHWRDPSQLAYVRTGLTALVEEIRAWKHPIDRGCRRSAAGTAVSHGRTSGR